MAVIHSSVECAYSPILQHINYTPLLEQILDSSRNQKDKKHANSAMLLK